MSLNWLRLLPDEDYRFQMGLHPGDAAGFFAPSEHNRRILNLRAALLGAAPEEYLLAGPALAALEALSTWCGTELPDILTAGRHCESDWVLLTPDSAGMLRVTAGVVCFPSSWSLREKAGLPVSEVHAPVPGLNAQLGRSIDTFLARLSPGVAWARDNWGLSADDMLDHHSRHPLPSLTEMATLETTWLRLERQLLVRLDDGSVLFGIRVSTHRLDELTTREPGVADRLARALKTMPEAIAHYKGAAAARAALVPLLQAHR
jgi:hypothetical protein